MRFTRSKHGDICNIEPNGSVSEERRPRLRSPCRPEPPCGARTAGRGRRDDQRTRRALRYVADRDEEAHPAARGGGIGYDGEGRPCPQMHARALRLRGHQHVAAATRPLRAGCRTYERSLMSATTTVTTPNELEIRVERIFDAPRTHVFSVWTDPQLIPEWWGDGTVVEEMDVRPGGTYRFRTAHGVVEGEYQEVDPP